MVSFHSLRFFWARVERRGLDNRKRNEKKKQRNKKNLTLIIPPRIPQPRRLPRPEDPPLLPLVGAHLRVEPALVEAQIPTLPATTATFTVATAAATGNRPELRIPLMCVRDAETPLADDRGPVAASIVPAAGGQVARLRDVDGWVPFQVAVVVVGGEVGGSGGGGSGEGKVLGGVAGAPFGVHHLDM